MKTRYKILTFSISGFFALLAISMGSVNGQDQLLSDDPNEPNLFGYFVTFMSIAILGSFAILWLKKWKKRK